MNLAQTKTIVFEHKPELARIYKKYQDKTWLEYGKNHYNARPLPSNTKTKELIETFESLLVPLVGSAQSRRAATTLLKTGLVSTADHHGMLCHPFFSNATLLRSHPTFKPDSIITLACGGISLSNSSYPRGIFFHNKENKIVRVPFISLHNKHLPVYGYPAIQKDVFLKQYYKYPQLQLFFDIYINNKSLWHYEIYSEQLTVMNYLLWKALFGETRGTLIYLEIESLVRQLLLDFHIPCNTIIHKILFDPTVRARYIREYDKVTGAHSDTQKGSHLFWHIDRKSGKRIQVWHDEKEHFFKPDTLAELLEKRELLPTMAFCYSILAFYYGVTLGGGFSQIQYLGDMKKAYIKVAGECEDTETNIFMGEFDLLKSKTLIDVLLQNKRGENSIINQSLESVTVKDSIDEMLPEFLKIIKHNEN